MEANQKSAETSHVLAFVIVVAVVGATVGSVWSCLTSPAATKASEAPAVSAAQSVARPAIGDTVRLDSGADSVLLAKTKADYSEMGRYAAAKDTQGIMAMVLQGRALLVKSGTTARVIGTSLLLTEVRVQDGTLTGWSGVVAYEFVHAK